MKPKILWNQKLSMLMACASPGSALAFHLGLASNGAELVRRTQADQDAGSQPAAHRSVLGWLTGPFARLEQWADRRDQRERERYLAQAQTVADLEARMRELDTGRFWLP
jgi:hypothetical protein